MAQQVPPPNDDFPEELASVIQALLDEDTDRAEGVLRSIAFSPEARSSRPSLSRFEQVSIFDRDGFSCRYCGGRVILTPVMVLIHDRFPEAFPYHPNWKVDETHPAIASRSAIIDHVVPGAAGGDWKDPANLVPACWPCNSRKADLTLERLGWRVLPVPQVDSWDGLTRNYEKLWHLLSEPRPKTHKPWLAALARLRSQRP